MTPANEKLIDELGAVATMAHRAGKTLPPHVLETLEEFGYGIAACKRCRREFYALVYGPDRLCGPCTSRARGSCGQ